MKVTQRIRMLLALAVLFALAAGASYFYGFNTLEAVVAAAMAGAPVVFGMSILDERCEFADAVSVAGNAGTALIGDVIPLSVARNIANGRPLYLVITVDTEIITGGSAGTIKFQLVSDAQAAIATDGSATVHFDSGTFVTDDAAANDAAMNAGGVPVVVALPLEGRTYETYLGILAIIGTTTVTAGKINAFLTPDPSQWKAYPNGI